MVTDEIVAIVLVLASTTGLVNPIPVSWRARTTTTDMAPVTVLPWPGSAHISGAFLLSRINLSFLKQTCDKFSSDLKIATQVATVLTDTNLRGATNNQVKRYGFIILKLETRFREVIDYLTSLLLCTYTSRNELWTRYAAFRNQTKVVWKILRRAGVYDRRLASTSKVSNLTNESNGNDSNDTVSSRPPTNIIGLLEEARPAQLSQRKPRSPIIIGLGLGFLGSYLFGEYFGNNNDKDIETLNNNIQKQNQNIKVTNERIDILAKNVSNSVNTIKNILDKLIEAQDFAEIQQAILWNCEQLVTSTTDIMNAFKFGELTVTLLTKGILDAELIDLKSFKKIIVEGLKSFPKLEFPLEVSRYQLIHLVKIIKVQRVDHLKFLMVIPLTRKREYKVFSLIPHPVKLDDTVLALPKLREVLLVDEYTYIITNKINVYSLALQSHLLLDVEPIYNHKKATCEWEGYRKNSTAMLSLCNYNKIGQLNDTFVIETDQHRLVYFSEQTKVSLECPEKQVKDSLVGLHKIPLACDVETEYVYWPAKQTATIALELNESSSFVLDSTYLPIINVNKSSKIHSSLRELINTLPKESDAFTIDFDYYDLTLEKIQTYSIYAQSILAIIVVINSILIGFLLIKWIYNRRQNHVFSRSSLTNNKFRGLRDSIRSRTKNKRDSLRRARYRVRSRSRDLRDSLRSKGSITKGKLKERAPTSPKLNRELTHVRSSSPLNRPNNANAGTNTDVNWQLPPYVPEVYPALPRYT